MSSQCPASLFLIFRFGSDLLYTGSPTCIPFDAHFPCLSSAFSVQYQGGNRVVVALEEDAEKSLLVSGIAILRGNFYLPIFNFVISFSCSFFDEVCLLSSTLSRT